MKRLNYMKAMGLYISQWDRKMHDAMTLFAYKAGIELAEKHPEYFDEKGSSSPEAKAAIADIIKKGILEGASTAREDGEIIMPPEKI